jgi:hypothetical protein
MVESEAMIGSDSMIGELLMLSEEKVLDFLEAHESGLWEEIVFREGGPWYRLAGAEELSLFVARIFVASYVHFLIVLDGLAALTHLLDARTHLHY